MDPYTFFFIIGFLVVMFLGAFGLFDLDFAGDSDVDLDLDTDVDLSIDLDLDLDGDLDLDLDGGDLDLDGDPGDVDTSHGISPMSPFILGLFSTTTGAAGMVITEMELLDEPLLAGASLLIGLLVTGVFRQGINTYFIKSQGSAFVTKKDIIGKTATVDLEIPGGAVLGSVKISGQTGLKSRSARASERIPVNALVRITAIQDGIYHVVKLHGTEPENITTEFKTEEKKGFLGGKKKEEPTGEPVLTPPQTVIYDQRNIQITDSVVQRTNFGHDTSSGENKKNKE